MRVNGLYRSNGGPAANPQRSTGAESLGGTGDETHEAESDVGFSLLDVNHVNGGDIICYILSVLYISLHEKNGDIYVERFHKSEPTVCLCMKRGRCQMSLIDPWVSLTPWPCDFALYKGK